MPYRKGITLQIGAIAFAVDIDGAIESDRGLKTVCDDGHKPTPVKNNTSCPDCGNASWPSFKKARVDGDSYVLVDADEVAAARDEAIGATKNVISLTAHPVDEVRTQTIQGDSVYYLTPASVGSVQGYNLLADTLRRHPEVAFLGQWTPVSRTSLFEIRIFGDTIVMEGRARTETLKIQQQQLEEPPPLNQQQMDLLLPMMTAAFDPATYADTYKQKLEELIESKTAVEGVATAKKSSSSVAPTVDLTATLDALLAKAGTPPEPPKGKKEKAA